jgi:lipopolysaccharide/colanic/teichoic acid biosynthesis glycosyltransferase
MLFVKRTMDIVISLLGILFLSPLFLIIALLVKYTSVGPIFFVQQRVGLNGILFPLYKFRTMRQDAEHLFLKNPMLRTWDGPVFRVKQDPRVTAPGKILRRFNLDELPQLINVLIGQMSIVGPRPHLPEEVARYLPWHRERLARKPGLTCLWQIGDRHNVTFEKWIRMDIYYIRHFSIWLDIRIIWATFQMIFGGKGFRRLASIYESYESSI